jgi:hypothetical protein
MSGGFYSEAIFSGLSDTVKKALTLLSVPVFGHFVGYNCYEAPDLIAKVWAGGLAGLSSMSFVSSGIELVLMPFFWFGTVLLCFTHLVTLPYPFVLLYGWLKIWVGEEEWWRGVALLLIAQPLASWYVMCAGVSNLDGGDFAVSAVLIGIYEIMAIGVAIWYARQRDAIE